MNITTDKSKFKHGSHHLTGFIELNYEDIVEILGEPEIIDDKIQVIWYVYDQDTHTMAALYDYKSHLRPKHIKYWHIGGSNSDSVELINQLFKHKILK